MITKNKRCHKEGETVSGVTKTKRCHWGEASERNERKQSIKWVSAEMEMEMSQRVNV